VARALLAAALFLGSCPAQSARAAPTAQDQVQCPGAQPSQLHSGLRGFVSFDPPAPSRVREFPGRSYKIVGQLQPGDVFLVVGGPGCSDNLTWWEVVSERDGLRGWSAEGDSRDDWLLPCPGQAAGSDCQTPSGATAPTVSDLGLVVPDLPAPGSIAYATDDGALWLLDPDTGTTRRLVDPGPIIDSARWSPDGRWLAFLRLDPAPPYARSLWVMDPANGAARLLNDQVAYGFSWAPDSRSLVVDRATDVDLCQTQPSAEAEGLWQVDVETGNAQRLVAPLNGYPLYMPVYAPDGRHLLFEEVHYCEGHGPAGVWTADQAGFDLLGILGSVAWSPDGQWIVYDNQGYVGPAPNLWLIRPDGGGLRALPGTGDYSNLLPVWSPDGARLLFIRSLNDTSDYGLSVLDLAGGFLTVTPDPIRGYGWAPDGQRIAYSTQYGELRTVSSDGRESRALTQGWFLDWGPATASIASPAFSLEELLQQKRNLIPTLESATVVIGYEVLRQPLTAYDETASRTLVNDLTSAAAVTPEQQAAFARLLLQEQTLARTLEDYSVVSGYEADIAADVSGLFWGTAFLLATSKVSLVSAMADVVTKTLRDTLIWMAGGIDDPSLRATVTGGITAGFDWYSAQTDRGATAVDVLSDTTVRQVIAQRNLQTLLARVQPTLDQGVYSVRGAGAPIWSVSGETASARLHLDQLAGETHLQADTATIWHEGFDNGRKTNELLKDYADMLSLGKVPYALVGSVWTRVQQLIIDAVEGTFVVAPRMACILTLSEHVGALAFDPAHALPTCPRVAAQPGIRLAPAPRALALGPIGRELRQDLAAYRTAIEAVQAALAAGDPAQIDAAIKTLIAAQADVNQITSSTLLVAAAADGETADRTARAVLALDDAAFGLLASLAAYQDAPHSDETMAAVQASAGRTLDASAGVEALVADAWASAAPVGPVGVLDFVPTATEVILGQTDTVVIRVRNVGDAELAGALVQAELAGQALAPVAVPTVPAGDEVEVALSVVAEREGEQILALTLDDGTHRDFGQVRLAAVEPDPADDTEPAATPPPASPGAGCLPGLGLVMLLVVGGRGVRVRKPDPARRQ
jgi:hypothetical protein